MALWSLHFPSNYVSVSVEKSAVLCMPHHNISEVFLDCSGVGVIEVTQAVEGYSAMTAGQTCNYVHDGQCEVGNTT